MTGPNSHKMVLTDPTVDMAVLECARGGLLRAGLGFKHCDVGVVTNVSADHLGLNYIDDLDKMARVKGVIPEVVKPNGYAILNADDERVADMADNTKGNVIFFSLEGKSNPVIKEHLKSGGSRRKRVGTRCRRGFRSWPSRLRWRRRRVEVIPSRMRSSARRSITRRRRTCRRTTSRRRLPGPPARMR